MEISKTDAKRIVKYLTDAAAHYDSLPAQRAKCRAWCMRQAANKLNSKLSKLTNNDSIQ